jgi:retron-type reverse transcriptase
MILTRQQLLLDLYQAFYDAKRHKSKRSYVRKWESDLKRNMDELCDELYYRLYKPLPSKCFIVDYPKKREIFAAVFRDRIVHHLYFNYTNRLFERTFIQDSYSCIKGRGTHYGIGRIRDFCRKESLNWQRECYVLHLDIRGYFMHIVRRRLLEIAVGSLRKMAMHRCDGGGTWEEVLDMDFVEWLTGVIVLLDPKKNCIICGDISDWEGLDPAKSMLHLENGLGLPIGNLTSQLFSNVYLNVFDQFMKRVLKCRYYGRYVDDAAVVSCDREWLLSLVPDVDRFLRSELGLELHKGKLEVSEVHMGVEFLGAYIKPYRTYVSNHSLRRIEKKIANLDYLKPWLVVRSVNSYLGIFQHTSSYRLRRRLFMTKPLLRICVFDSKMNKCRRVRTRNCTQKLDNSKQNSIIFSSFTSGCGFIKY